MVETKSEQKTQMHLQFDVCKHKKKMPFGPALLPFFDTLEPVPHPYRNKALKAIHRANIIQGWAQGSFVEAEAEVEAERSRQRRGKTAMSLTEARQGRGRGKELEAEARQTKFEARPRRGDP